MVLVTRRRPDTVYPDYWEFPGGKMEPGESPEACVARELAEEVGVRVRILAPLPGVVHTYPHATVQLHPRLCALTDDSPSPANLHVADHLWVAPAELQRFKFPEANEMVMHALLRALDQGIPAG